jgi:predicted neutral ceramidase superfamily lipid hydrolase
MPQVFNSYITRGRQKAPKRKVCYSNIQDELQFSQTLSPKPTAKLIISNFDFNTSSFDISHITPDRLQGRMSIKHLSDFLEVLSTSITDWDLRLDNKYYRKVFVSVFLISTLLLNLILLFTVIALIHRWYKWIFLSPALLVCLVIFLRCVDRAIHGKILGILGRRTKELEKWFKAYNAQVLKHSG